MTKQRMDNVGVAHNMEMPKKSWEKPVARSQINFSSEVAGVAVLTLAFGAMAGAGWQEGWIWMLFSGVIALAGLWISFFIYLFRTRTVPAEKIEYQDYQAIEPEPDPVATDPGRVAIPTNDGRSVEFLQPKPGEFANWAQAIISDMRNDNLPFRDKTQLSQNTGVGREWPKDMYKSMLAALRSVGWVKAGPNNTPVFTQYGEDCIWAWLQGKAPPSLSA